MIPVYQTIHHSPEEKQYGDCFSCCLASALELSREDVPHFLFDNPEGMVWRRRINEFLRPFNLAFINIADAPTWMEEHGITGLVHEHIGQTVSGGLHSTLAMDGKLIHDPIPNGMPLKLEKNWGVFIVLDPSKPVGKNAHVK